MLKGKKFDAFALGRLLQSMRHYLYLAKYKLYFIVCDLYLAK